MPDTVARWVDLVDDLYPPQHAADWDTVGLQVGDPVWGVQRVLVALDVTVPVVEEAAEQTHTMVVAHHPLLFRPLERLTPGTASGVIALAAARAQVAVLAAHTNLDVATDGAGTSDPLVRLLGLDEVEALEHQPQEGRLKLVTFVPADHTGAVLNALSAAGAGVVGDYERCSFRVAGTGTFRPRPGTTPYSGAVGSDNEEDEDRLEIVVDRGMADRALEALVDAHPYEEVAYDLYPLAGGNRPGLGRVGLLPEPLTLRALAARIRDGLPAPHLRFAGTPDRTVRRVAVCGGAGDSLLDAAIATGADVYVTGDLRHHPVQDALTLGLAVIDAGHHATEVAAMPSWADRLRSAAAQRGLQAQVVLSQAATAPWSG